MTGLALALLLALGADCFERVAALRAEGDYRAALAAAESCDDPLASAQSKLWLLHNAGDPESALRAGLEGLESAPDDPWLLERCTLLAVDLRAFELAGDLSERLRVAVDALGEGAAQWTSQLSERQAEVDALDARQTRRAAALRRAHWTVAGAAAMSLGALLWLSWRCRA